MYRWLACVSFVLWWESCSLFQFVLWWSCCALSFFQPSCPQTVWRKWWNDRFSNLHTSSSLTVLAISFTDSYIAPVVFDNCNIGRLERKVRVTACRLQNTNWVRYKFCFYYALSNPSVWDAWLVAQVKKKNTKLAFTCKGSFKVNVQCSLNKTRTFYWHIVIEGLGIRMV